jgi:hypothetical protein
VGNHFQRLLSILTSRPLSDLKLYVNPGASPAESRFNGDHAEPKSVGAGLLANRVGQSPQH